MQILAAVVRKAGGPFQLELLDLQDPRPDEVLVRIVGAGMCHSDLDIVHQRFPTALPMVLGHEGAGVVEKVGSAITHLVAGDHVVLSFPSCGNCDNCRSGHPAYCESGVSLMMAGQRPDGSKTLRDSVSDVCGCFFGQSSFATYSICYGRNAIKVPSDVSLELLGPLGCGIQTGAGAVLNVLRPPAGSSFAVFGCGAVGLSALMGAVISRCTTIIAVDRVASRLDLAQVLGATHVIDVNREDPLKLINQLGGVDFCIEATGVPSVVEAAVAAVRSRGVCGLLGGPKPGNKVTFDQFHLFMGRTVMGVIEGDADPQKFIPQMVAHYMAGRLPIDRLIRVYAFEDINQAMADSESGITVKPVLRMGVC